MKGPKTGVVRARFIGEERSMLFLKNSRCVLLVSVGQKYHENERLIATMELINQQFKDCVIMVCDSLQRFNVYEGIFQEQGSHARANELGDEWLERNANILNMLEIPFSVVKWDYWLYHPGFNPAREKIEFFYHNNNSFKIAFDSSARDYTCRFLNRDEKDNDIIKFFNSSLEYLKEECAAMLLWVDEKYDYEMYPGGRNEAMRVTYERLIKPSYPHLLKPLTFNFKRYSSKSMHNPADNKSYVSNHVFLA